MNHCEAGHPFHDTKKVHTGLGEMLIYDWEKYMGFQGYCTGQDDVSRTLDNTKEWDKGVLYSLIEIIQMRKMIEPSRKPVFLDIGCHIGYFSRMAEKLGCVVYSYDGDEENLTLVKSNSPEATTKLIWFDENVGEIGEDLIVDLVKIDIEGSERHAISYLTPLLLQQKVNNIIMEVSPVFNNSYPELLELLKVYGFQAFELDRKPFDGSLDFPQRDLLFCLNSK